jgi:hypothetical protein
VTVLKYITVLQEICLKQWRRCWCSGIGRYPLPYIKVVEFIGGIAVHRFTTAPYIFKTDEQGEHHLACRVAQLTYHILLMYLVRGAEAFSTRFILVELKLHSQMW